MFDRLWKHISRRQRAKSETRETTGGFISPHSPYSQQHLSLQVDPIRSPSPADSRLTIESQRSSKKKESDGGKEEKYKLDGSRPTSIHTHSEPTLDLGRRGSARDRPRLHETETASFPSLHQALLAPVYAAHLAGSPGTSLATGTPVRSLSPPAIVVSQPGLGPEFGPKVGVQSSSVGSAPPYVPTAIYYRSQQFDRLVAILEQDLSTEEMSCLPARGTCTDVNALVQATLKSANDAVSNVQQSKLVKGLKLDNHVRALQKVAKIGDIAIQHSPEVTALAWAGVRFLLQLAINDIETRESLEAAMDTITVALGNCGFYEAFYFSSTAPMVKELVHVIPDLYAAVIIFSIKARKWIDNRKRGMNHLQGAVVPFEVKFKPLIDRIKEKEKLVENTARLAGLEDSRNSMDNVKNLLQELANIMSDMNKTRAEVLTAQEKDYLRKSRGWLGGLDIDQGYEKNTIKRTENTCTWILKSPEYQHWLRGTYRGILWICGIPGAGKSVLASFIVSALKDAHPNSLVLHYFFQHDFPKTASSLTMAATITNQFLLQNSSKDVIAVVKRRYEESTSTTCEDFKTIWATFLELVNSLSDEKNPVYVIIDAVDECSTDSRAIFLDNLCASDWTKIGVRFLVTSRQIADIAMKLESNTQDPQALKLRLGIDFITNDMKEYIEEQLEKPEYADLRKHHDIIKETVPRKAEGMFKYAVLLLETLNEPSEYKVTEILEMIPEGLDGIYEWILEHLDPKTLVMRQKIFMWVMVSAWPITLEELGLACITKDGEENFDPEEKGIFSENKLVKTCGPLVEIGPNKTVQFSHFTAKEFLQMKAEKIYRNRLVSECIVNDHLAHVAVLTTCITQLLSHTFLKSKRMSESAPYCVTNWIHHAQQAQIGANPTKLTIKDSFAWKLIDDFLDDKGSCFKEWKGILPIHMAEFRGSCLGGSRRQILSATALHITSNWGLTIATQRLLARFEIDIEAKDSSYSQTPLSWAAEHGHTAVVEMLLQSGANTEARDEKYGRTPLIWATQNNHLEVVNALVKKGAQLEAADIDEWKKVPDMTSLLWSARSNHSDILKYLVEAGAKVEAKCQQSKRTALHMSALNGCTDCVKCLLRHGADIDALDQFNRSALSLAAEIGHIQMVKLLLDKGADAHSRDSFSRLGTPSPTWKTKEIPSEYTLDDTEDTCTLDDTEHKYTLDDTEDVFELTRAHGASEYDIDGKVYGRTPLSYAAASGRTEIVKLLLEKNVDVEAMDQVDRRTPLSWAAGQNFVEVASLLLDHHADLEAKDATYGHTPLSWAAAAGHLEMLKMLLDKGAVIEPGTPLILAAGGGWVESVKLLLDHGVHIETKDHFSGRTPLSYAAEEGHTDVLRELVTRGADVNATDERHLRQTPLIWASQKGHVQAASLLLQNGGDIEAVDSVHGRTPLSWAAVKGYCDVGKLLLDHNANVEGSSKVNKPANRRSPLSWAAKNGHAGFVELLLQRGAVVDEVKPWQGMTPLLWAAANGHRDVLEVLLKNGASRSVVDSKTRRSPLAWAAKNGHKEVLSLLRPNDVTMGSAAWGTSKWDL